MRLPSAAPGFSRSAMFPSRPGFFCGFGARALYGWGKRRRIHEGGQLRRFVRMDGVGRGSRGGFRESLDEIARGALHQVPGDIEFLTELAQIRQFILMNFAVDILLDVVDEALQL